MTAVDDELMHRSVCVIVPAPHEKGEVGIGVPKQLHDESRGLFSAESAASLSVPPVLAARMGGRKARRFPQGLPGTPTHLSCRLRLASRAAVVANRSPWRPIMALAPLGTSAPNDEPTPLNLHDVYRTHAGCGYTRSLTLAPNQVQQLTARLRGIHAINAVLIASSDDNTLNLGQWLRHGLVEAANALAWVAANDLDDINERARKEQMQ